MAVHPADAVESFWVKKDAAILKPSHQIVGR
jgi:hypothetical protein